MQTFTIFTLLFALSSAAPHVNRHLHLHDRNVHQRTPAVEQALADRDSGMLNLYTRQISPVGTCGNGTGYVCAAGFCCSKWGYCGQGEAYCGAEATSTTGSCSTGGTGTGPTSIGRGSGPTSIGGGSGPTSVASGHTGRGGGHRTRTTVAGSSPPTSTATSSRGHGGGSSPATSAPTSTPTSPSGGGGGSGLGNTYTFYTGDGSTADGWPSTSSWASFEDLWSANLPTISISCTEFSEQNNSDQENEELMSAIQSVGASSGVDPRLILAVVMQESKGCVRVDTTNNGVVNPGLMQSHDGTGTCNPGGPGAPGTIPCPANEITQMITDGTDGTSSGDGLKQCLSQATGSSASQKAYQAATIYNSGNLPANLDDNTATACYASDIANRLTGWTTAQTKCTLS